MAEQEEGVRGSSDPNVSRLEIGAKAELSLGIAGASGAGPAAVTAQPAANPAADTKPPPQAGQSKQPEEKNIEEKDIAGFDFLNLVTQGLEKISGADDDTTEGAASGSRKQIHELISKLKATQLIFNFGVMGGRIDRSPINQPGAADPDRPRPAKSSAKNENLWSFGRFVLSQERVPDLSYVLALAALAGAPLSTINRAAEDLAPRLASPPRPDAKEAPAAIAIQVATPRRIILADLGCEMFSGPADDSDEVPSERVRFTEAGAERLLLRDAWLNLRLSIPWMAPFLNWLSRIGHSGDLELRLVAGRTAGFLASWDAAAAESVFNSWVSGRAVDALGAGLIALAGTSEAAKRNVEKRLLGWTEGQGGRNRIVAAALLASGALGHALPDVAFRTLASLVRQRRYLTLDLAAMGYAVWFATAEGDPSVGSRVIKEVSKLRAAGDDKVIMKLTGLYFLVLTSALESEDEEGDDTSSERLFLNVLAASPEAVRLAAGLFNELLAPNVHANAALQRFRSICFCAFRGGPAAESAFTALVESMHAQGDEDARERLHYWLEYWLEEVREHSVAAAAMLSALVEKISSGASYP